MSTNNTFQQEHIILGIDPGTRFTGYGLIKCANINQFIPVNWGVIKTQHLDNLYDRYLYIFEQIQNIIDQYHPQTLSIETQFLNKNIQSTMKLGIARGIAIVAAKQKGLSIFEYAPNKAKSSVVGTGRASKQQVQYMVQRLLSLKKIISSEDASDALSLAICHALNQPKRMYAQLNKEK